jgi:hypothetical protein
MSRPDSGKFFYAVNTANRLGIDISASLFAAVMAAPLKHSGWIREVYQNEDYAKAERRLSRG